MLIRSVPYYIRKKHTDTGTTVEKLLIMPPIWSSSLLRLSARLLVMLAAGVNGPVATGPAAAGFEVLIDRTVMGTAFFSSGPPWVRLSAFLAADFGLCAATAGELPGSRLG